MAICFKGTLALCAVMLAAPAAEAAPLFSGSYTGLGTTLLFGQTFPGTTITRLNDPTGGTFSLDVTSCLPVAYPPASAACGVSSTALSIAFNAQGLNYTFSAPAGLVSVQNTATSQVITLLAGFTAAASQASLTLAGAPNAFVNGTDFQTLHVGTVDLANSSFQVYGGRTFQSSGALTSVTFDNVPEPSSVSLLASLAVLGIAIRAGTRRRTL